MGDHTPITVAEAELLLAEARTAELFGETTKAMRMRVEAAPALGLVTAYALSRSGGVITSAAGFDKADALTELRLKFHARPDLKAGWDGTGYIDSDGEVC